VLKAEIKVSQLYSVLGLLRVFIIIIIFSAVDYQLP